MDTTKQHTGGRVSHLLRPDYFETIDSEQKAYWLGFFYADASVRPNYVAINIKPDDFYHIERFQAAIGSKHRPYAVKSVKTVRGTTRVDISSRKMVRDLTAHGCHQNKMYDLDPPSGLSPDLTRHFIRGFWDGDGSIGFYGKNKQLHMSATGTDNMINWIASVLPAGNTVDRSGNEARVRSTSANAKTNLDFLYQDSTVSLDRKKQLYDIACERGYWLRSER